MSQMKIAETGFWDDQTAHLFHAYSRPLVGWIAEFLSDQKDSFVYDFGCGTGQYLRRLADAGFTKLVGFEGAPPVHKEFADIREQDLTQPFTVSAPGHVMSLEVGEHIPAHLTQFYLTNISGACAPGHAFVASWAVRGQCGDGHVNELDNDEAISLVLPYGFEFLEKETKEARSRIDPSVCSLVGALLPWFATTTLIFRKLP
jgi:SAM-dependent methyltransferase